MAANVSKELRRRRFSSLIPHIIIVKGGANSRRFYIISPHSTFPLILQDLLKVFVNQRQPKSYDENHFWYVKYVACIKK